MIKKLLLSLLTCMALWLPGATYAGQNCDQKPPAASKVAQGIELAVKTVAALNATNADVVIIGRVGQDLSKYGQRYSHLGFAYRDGNSWTIVHKLNECGTAISNIYEQGMGQFFLDDPFFLETAIAIPTPALQQQLRALLNDRQRELRLHVASYSMVSYAWGNQYQQSNQWLLETIAMAQEASIRDRAQAQAWLKFKGYQPTVLSLGPLTRLGGRMFQANIAFDDHPNEKRFSNRIETIGADSVFTFLEQAGLQSQFLKVAL